MLACLPGIGLGWFQTALGIDHSGAAKVLNLEKYGAMYGKCQFCCRHDVHTSHGDGSIGSGKVQVFNK
jgi:hypothetical protein